MYFQHFLLAERLKMCNFRFFLLNIETFSTDNCMNNYLHCVLSGQLVSVHGAGVRNRWRNVLTPAKSRQIQVNI
jgi:hypothetical protein